MTASPRPSRARRYAVPAAAVVVASSVMVGGVAGIVGLMPSQASDDSGRNVTAASTPAAKALDDGIAAVPKHGPVSTRAVGPVGSAVCPVDKGAAAPALLTRSTSAGDATTTLAAYRAGTAAQAFAAQKAMLDKCSGVQWTNGPEVGQESLRVTLNGSNATIWRRGGIIGTVVTGGSDPDPLVTAIDKRLGADMAGCASQDETTADAARTPYAAGGVAFTGLLRQRTASMTASLAAQMVPPQPLPGGDLPDVQLPTRPADPVWPDQLPAPVQRPTVPTMPQVPETSASTQQRIADPTGPGCGWSFTGEDAPAFNDDQATRDADARLAALTAQLDAKGRAYVSAKATYDASLGAYDKAATAYRNYANAVDQVAQSWGQIQAARDQYATDLKAYQDAVKAHNDFLANQAKAAADFPKAEAACAAAAPQTTMVTPPPTTVMVPGTPAPPTPGETTPPAAPTPTPSVIPGTPTPSVVPAPGCPPQRPAILDQQPPAVPPSPTPPPDPRPTP